MKKFLQRCLIFIVSSFFVQTISADVWLCNQTGVDIIIEIPRMATLASGAIGVNCEELGRVVVKVAPHVALAGYAAHATEYLTTLRPFIIADPSDSEDMRDDEFMVSTCLDEEDYRRSSFAKTTSLWSALVLTRRMINRDRMLRRSVYRIPLPSGVALRLPLCHIFHVSLREWSFGFNTDQFIDGHSYDVYKRVLKPQRLLDVSESDQLSLRDQMIALLASDGLFTYRQGLLDWDTNTGLLGLALVDQATLAVHNSKWQSINPVTYRSLNCETSIFNEHAFSCSATPSGRLYYAQLPVAGVYEEALLSVDFDPYHASGRQIMSFSDPRVPLFVRNMLMCLVSSERLYKEDNINHCFPSGILIDNIEHAYITKLSRFDARGFRINSSGYVGPYFGMYVEVEIPGSFIKISDDRICDASSCCGVGHGYSGDRGFYQLGIAFGKVGRDEYPFPMITHRCFRDMGHRTTCTHALLHPIPFEGFMGRIQLLLRHQGDGVMGDASTQTPDWMERRGSI